MIYYTGIINNKAKVWHFQNNKQVLEFLEAYTNHADFDQIKEISKSDFVEIYTIIHGESK
jgi:hypothetical protein|tara:strand:+ start:102 stop:281 length:180 start_codon:yes stop_codon:yes gene_type:complete